MAKNRSRKNRSSRKNLRANRSSRKNRTNRRNRMYGGMNLAPQDINDTSMMSPQKLSVAQGGQFTELTRNMHGGMGPFPGAVTDNVLPQNLQASARLVGLNNSFDYIKGMKDVAGGRRRSRRKSRKNRRSSRKNRRSSRRSARRGGALGYAPSDAPGMLLDAAATARAGLNPEWQLAENPNSFSPK